LLHLKKTANNSAIFILREYFFLSKPANNSAIFISEENNHKYRLRASSAPLVQLKSLLLKAFYLFVFYLIRSTLEKHKNVCLFLFFDV